MPDPAPPPRAGAQQLRQHQRRLEAQPVSTLPKRCPSYQPGRAMGIVAAPELTEISGMVASRRHRGVLYVHNDSGDGPRFYALNSSAVLLQVFELKGAVFVDCEDVAAHANVLYFADIGDNHARDGRGPPRPWVTIFRVPEPELGVKQASSPVMLDNWEAFRIVYPDAPHDAEAVMIDPRSSELLIFSKENQGATFVYRLRMPHAHSSSRGQVAEHPLVPELVAKVEFGSESAPGHPMVTGGDMSEDGSRLLIRTYTSVLLFTRSSSESIATMLKRPARQLPSRFEPQGEAIAFANDGVGYFTISELSHPRLFFFAPDDACKAAKAVTLR